jgi:hypothetical protein
MTGSIAERRVAMEQRQREDEAFLAGHLAPVLIDLPDAAPVRPRRSIWGAFLLAAFTGLTALGLGVAAVQPRIIDRAQDRGPTAGSPSDPPATGSAAREPIVAVARRLASGRSRSAQLVVSGAARADITRVDVTVAVGGERLADGSVLLAGGTGGELQDQPWSAIVDILPGPVPSDAVATVTLRWATRNGDAGMSALVVALGDGRGRR